MAARLASLFDAAGRWSRRIEDGGIVALLAAIVLLAGAQIVVRNLGAGGLVWSDQVLRILKQLQPEYGEAQLTAIRKALKSSLPPFHAETAPALVPNVISGRIANRLDFMGPAYIVDAACASSLIAIDSAVQELVSGRCDLMLAGGTQAQTPPQLFIQFCQINALSSRPPATVPERCRRHLARRGLRHARAQAVATGDLRLGRPSIDRCRRESNRRRVSR